MNRIQHLFQLLDAKDEKALIAFIMAGLPDQSIFLESIDALEQGGVDLIELGVPFSDPVADGASIERLHHRGVELGLNLNKTLELAAKIRSRTEIPLVLFCYYNPVFARGSAAFLDDIGSVGLDGIIIPDLPLDELGSMAGRMVKPVPMVAPSSSDARLTLAGQHDPDFVYCVSVRGVTGTRALPMDEIRSYLGRVRKATDAPRALGFGIHDPKQIAALRDTAEGFVVGSHFANVMVEAEKEGRSIPAALEREAALLKAPTRRELEARCV
ncbi:MAG: tryptophan synthase subunit alpha [Solirubrobacterales bacterium]